MRITLLFATLLCARCVSAADDRPNIIVLFADDLGYGDVGCFGATEIETPHLDRMAAEGRRFTDFYSAGPTCTPSRAGLLTGCYPVRVGFGDQIGRTASGGASRGRVLHSGATEGLNPDEITVSELLKDAGYATCMVGKWHLGEAPKFNPTNHGFDEFFGVHYSNDMKPYEYLRGTERLPEEIDRDNQIHRYTEEALAFIREHRGQPFFLYFAHAMPHTPLAASQEFRGRSKRGLYGDAVMEVDWSAGKIFNALRELDLDERTLVIFTSDNGPWLARGEHGGSAGPLRAGKGTTYEGGVRVPCVMWQPGRIPANTVCREVASTMDFLPTFAALGAAKPPADRTIDGHDIRPLMTDERAKSPWEAFYFYFGNELHAVRSGRWKFRAKNNLVNENIYYREASTKVAIPPALYDLARDPGEQKSVLQDHPEVAKRLRGYMDQARADLGDSLRRIPPANARLVGHADEPHGDERRQH